MSFLLVFKSNFNFKRQKSIFEKLQSVFFKKNAVNQVAILAHPQPIGPVIAAATCPSPIGQTPSFWTVDVVACFPLLSLLPAVSSMDANLTSLGG